ncbi:hypothetical protein WMY93_014698 [Mugilogobius chulae]|uniref:Ig-like domain-containing protein n=1 Tax=Mugilogobius chulae TaxID=88201 RepID=A0AAW0NW48_9GOBI
MSGHVSFCVWIFVACLSPLVRAQAHVLGASQPVFAREGDDVILPCLCVPPKDLRQSTVEWSRTELKPDPLDRLKRVRFVHVYTEQHEDLDMKIPEFINRTQLFPEQLGAGNASLQIQRVRLSDNGTYKCLIPSLRTKLSLKEAFVTLIVYSPEAVTTKEDIKEDTDLKPKVLDDQWHERSFLPRTISLVGFVVICVLIGKLVCPRKNIYKPSKNSDESPSQSPTTSEPQVRVTAPITSPDEVQLIILKNSTADTPRWALQAG